MCKISGLCIEFMFGSLPAYMLIKIDKKANGKHKKPHITVLSSRIARCCQECFMFEAVNLEKMCACVVYFSQFFDLHFACIV